MDAYEQRVDESTWHVCMRRCNVATAHCQTHGEDPCHEREQTEMREGELDREVVEMAAIVVPCEDVAEASAQG